MRVEFDFLRRAYAANMHRRRALELRAIASDRTMSAARQELESEATWNEEQARKLDDADDQIEKQATTPMVGHLPLRRFLVHVVEVRARIARYAGVR